MSSDSISLGVIGGSGLYAMPGLTNIQEIVVSTPFGAPSDAVILGTLNGRRVAFLPRHGRGHRLNPSEVNYRANIYALKSLGVKHVVSVSACGSLRHEMKPRDIVVPDQLFDFTKGRRAASFYDDGAVGHASVGEPFSHSLRSAVIDAVRTSGGTVHERGTLITIEGPRFSTKAESHAFRAWGCDVIGMTASPEAFLAREAEMDFAIMAHVTDYDVWREEEGEVTVEIVIERLHQNLALAQQAITRIVDAAPALPHETAGVMRFAVMTARERIPSAARERLALIAGAYL
ncbi:MAG: S-methyl-5'-thioadenosine phosphorylase [Chloroflexi bacterium]|nr:S-methyl-5'-thioadenosine phosphorylase [Chloroflexota bacterium]